MEQSHQLHQLNLTKDELILLLSMIDSVSIPSKYARIYVGIGDKMNKLVEDSNVDNSQKGSD